MGGKSREEGEKEKLTFREEGEIGSKSREEGEIGSESREKGALPPCSIPLCYRIVSLGHLIFDCRSYFGLSCRMQGMDEFYFFFIAK